MAYLDGYVCAGDHPRRTISHPTSNAPLKSSIMPTVSTRSFGSIFFIPLLALCICGPSRAGEGLPSASAIDPDERVAVVLVHGITGSWASFSGDGKLLKGDGSECTDTTYPQSYRDQGCLPRFGHLLRQNGQRLVAQPFDYSDKTGFGGTSEAPAYTIPRLAGELHKHIKCVLRGACMDDGQPVDRVDIVAHSMGGLVTRAYVAGLAQEASNGDKSLPYNGKIRRIVTAGTPNYGASLTSLGGARESRLADTDAQQTQMEYGSDFLWALHTGWQQNAVKAGAFDSANLLAIAGAADMTTMACDEDNNDGIVFLSSAVLPAAFLPSGQIRHVPYPHATLFCTQAPSLVGVRAEDGTSHLVYRYAKAFLQGKPVPAPYTPPAKYLNNALLMVRLIDGQTGAPIDPAPALGFNAELRLTDKAGKEIELPNAPMANSEGKSLVVRRVRLAGKQQAVQLWITAPSGYADPDPIAITLQAGRPLVRQVRLLAE